MDNLKSLIPFWDHLARDLSIPNKDREVFKRRATAEGIRFLTITLPSLGKACDVALMNDEPPDFSEVRFKLKDGYPLFLRSLIRPMFERVDFVERASYIQKLRQLTLMFYKLEIPYDPSTLEESFRAFQERDRNLTSNLSVLQKDKMKVLIASILSEIDPLAIRPRHGSGAVANKIPNCEKWHNFRYVPKLDAVYPYDQHFFYNIEHVSEELQSLLDAPTVEEPASRLVAVPKDSRGPRLICCEPSEFQYIQQGLMVKLYDHLENHRFTKGFINFTDQRPNQELAKLGSIDLSLATLDLSDASDLVEWSLIEEVFPSNWVRALSACRSTRVELPDGSTFGPLRKFAPMGSACCFPIEALVFWSLLVSNLNTNVWVYGDDIIIDTSLVSPAMDLLHAAGLKVNVSKSCYKSPYRESCGSDWYAGVDIGYVKLRHVPADNITARASTVAFCNNIAKRYGLEAGLHALSTAEELHSCVFPRSRKGDQPLVFSHQDVCTASNDVFFKRRWSKDLQRFEYKVMQPYTRQVACKSSPTFHRKEMLRKELTCDKLTQVGWYAVPRSKSRWKWILL